jgi:hypothetical protein
MALSFGRGKKNDSDDATPAGQGGVAQGATKGAGDEVLDESWFETAFNEEANAQTPASAPAAPADSTPAYTPPPGNDEELNFDAFADVEQTSSAPAPNVPAPSAPAPSAPETVSFDMADLEAPPAASAPTAAFNPADSTPFDTTPDAAPETPVKPKGGGLKKLLPLLGLLLVVAGGAFFWISQQDTGEDETGDVVLPAATTPAPATAPTTPAATQASAPRPAATKAGARPVGAQTPANGQPDPKVMAQLKSLWKEGAAAKKAGNKAQARQKWQQAVKLARSKPAFSQSATQIQQAIDKLK